MEGNIPKGGGKATPRYMTLLEGTRIVPHDANGVTTVTGEIITDDQQSPFDYTTVTSAMVVNVASAEAEIVYIETPSPIQDRLDYNGVVHIDPTSAFTGQLHPTGTVAERVNNIVDAKAIAVAYNATDFLFDGVLAVGATSLASGQMMGRNPVSSVLVLGGGDTTFLNVLSVTLTGLAAGRMYVKDSIAASLSGFSGGLISCIFAGDITVDSSFTGEISVLRCASGLPALTPATFDVNGAECNVNIRDFYGTLKLAGQTGTKTISLDLSSAVITVMNSCTGGTIEAYGNGRLVDEAGVDIPSGDHNGVTIVNETVALSSSAERTRAAVIGDTKFVDMHKRFDLDPTKPNTYSDDGSVISNDDYTLTKTDNGNGTFDVVKS